MINYLASAKKKRGVTVNQHSYATEHCFHRLKGKAMSDRILTYRAVGSQHACDMKERLLNAAACLLIQNTVAATPLTHIATACQIKHASIYYHFPLGKMEIVLELVQRAQQLCSTHVFHHVKDSKLAFSKRITLLSQTIQHFLTQHDDALLICNLIPQFRELGDINQALKKYMLLWIEKIKEPFLIRMSEPEAKIIAIQSVQLINGALLQALLFNENSYIEKICDVLLDWWLYKSEGRVL